MAILRRCLLLPVLLCTSLGATLPQSPQAHQPNIRRSERIDELHPTTITLETFDEAGSGSSTNNVRVNERVVGDEVVGGGMKGWINRVLEDGNDATRSLDVREIPTISFAFDLTPVGKASDEDYDKLAELTSSTVSRILRDIYRVRDEVDFAHVRVGSYNAVEPTVIEFNFDSYFNSPTDVPPGGQLSGFLLLQLAEGSVYWTSYLQQIRTMGSDFFSGALSVSLTEVDSGLRSGAVPTRHTTASISHKATIVTPVLAAVTCVVVYVATLVHFRKKSNEITSFTTFLKDGKPRLYDMGSDDRWRTCSTSRSGLDFVIPDECNDLVDVSLDCDTGIPNDVAEKSRPVRDTETLLFYIDELIQGFEEIRNEHDCCIDEHLPEDENSFKQTIV